MSVKIISPKPFEVPVHGEKFSPLSTFVVLSVHLLAVYGMAFYFSFSGLLALIITHSFFATFGIAFGYHRYFSHASFVASKAFSRFLAVASTLCFQGGPIFWAAGHRAHHQKTEKVGDPHSASRGFWWSHCGWLFYSRPNGFSYSLAKIMVPDLLADPFLIWIDRYAIHFNFAVMGLAAGGFAILGRWDLFFWIFPIRIVSVWHATWTINSWYHGASWLKGKPPGGLRNNIFADLVLGGEGSHRNHHERPALFKNSRHWYQLDTSYWLLQAFLKLGLVKGFRGAVRKDADVAERAPPGRHISMH